MEFKEAQTNRKEALTINAVLLNNIKYTGVSQLLADNIESLQSLFNVINETSKKYGLAINLKNTKSKLGSEYY